MGKYKVNVQFARVFQPLNPNIPGSLSIDVSGLMFTARGGDQRRLALEEITDVVLQKNFLRADDVMIETRCHGAWWVLVSDGSPLAEELASLRKG
jgi:hypothetical protein